MKKTILPLLFTLFISDISIAQQYDPLHAPNTYRNSDNPYYWKNRKPFEGYWQQDVYYKIKADLDERTDVITGSEELTYWNNSPDDLQFVYFHLYQNAFTPNSYLDKLSHANNVFPKYGPYENQGLAEKVTSVSVNGQELKTEWDNTILKVYLTAPLKSGESITFKIEFKTYFDIKSQVRRRMKAYWNYGYKHFDGVHWYPRMCVYDRKFGWETEQHLEKEFYGDYGCYDVEINIASNYVMEATGWLQNRDEVLPADLRQKLDISNFKDKQMYSKPSVITPYDSTQRKTWKYHAENVHDFAFTTDPTYRIGEAAWNGVQVIALASEPVASRWQNAADYTAKVIKTYSEDFGMYAYPKIVVADARDGMEYPMLTLDGGFDPNYRSLFSHEVGHNWFFGMVGNNETYRAFLDEGFTQFLTSWSYRKINGDVVIEGEPKSSWIKKYRRPVQVIDEEIYNRYMQEVTAGRDATLNTHSSGFSSALRHGGGYGMVYFKTAVMLYNLQYVLGDSLFLKAMQHYVSQWEIAHPYPEDFRASIISYTHADLNWFFDQWLETTKTVDYAVKGAQAGAKEGDYVITFKRKGTMQMPLDFVVMDKRDSVYKFHIPNTWFVKKTDATVLPKWFGWDKLTDEYKAYIHIPGELEDVIIDPSHRLADVYMPDNSLKKNIEYAFDSKVYNAPNWKSYEMYYRPDAWYNGYDGVKFGLHMEGRYLNRYKMFSATVWMNSGLFQSYLDTTAHVNRHDGFSFNISYRNPLSFISEKTGFYTNVKWLDGLHAYLFGIDQWDKKEKNRFYAEFKSMLRPDSSNLTYLLLPREWNVNKLNNTLTVGLNHTYNYSFGTGTINLGMRASAVMSDYDYTNLWMEVVNKNNLGKKLKFNTRTYVQYGTGSNPAPESMLFAGGANPEEMMENKFTRSMGIIPPDWAVIGKQPNNFQYGGGLNLRGYAGYLLVEQDKSGNNRFAYKGTTGASVSAELEFNQLISSVFKMKQTQGVRNIKNTLGLVTYLFGDAGVINYNTIYEDWLFTNLRADAGVGAALTIKRFGNLQTVDPLTIRVDFPLVLNSIPYLDSDYFQFRWLIGISRAF